MHAAKMREMPRIALNPPRLTLAVLAHDKTHIGSLLSLREEAARLALFERDSEGGVGRCLVCRNGLLRGEMVSGWIGDNFIDPVRKGKGYMLWARTGSGSSSDHWSQSQQGEQRNSRLNHCEGGMSRSDTNMLFKFRNVFDGRACYLVLLRTLVSSVDLYTSTFEIIESSDGATTVM